MIVYDFTSGVLSVVGFIVLVYRIIFQLSSGRIKKSRIEKLCTKWLIFTIFLKIEGYLVMIFDIIPFGKLLLLAFKLFLFLPQNSISHSIYKKIHKYFQRIRLEQYHTRTSTVISFFSTITVSLLLKLTAKIAAYIDSSHIEEVERHIFQIIKILEYKKTAINMRHQAPSSEVNKQLNTSSFNSSLNSESRLSNPKKYKRSRSKSERKNIGDQMVRLLIEQKDQNRQECIALTAQVMTVKPNKAAGTRAKYSSVNIEYFFKTSQIIFNSARRSVEVFTLKEIRWITKNMMNVETVFHEGGSKIIRIKDTGDVVKWIQPVCTNLQKNQQQQNT